MAPATGPHNATVVRAFALWHGWWQTLQGFLAAMTSCTRSPILVRPYIHTYLVIARCDGLSLDCDQVCVHSHGMVGRMALTDAVLYIMGMSIYLLQHNRTSPFCERSHGVELHPQ